MSIHRIKKYLAVLALTFLFVSTAYSQGDNQDTIVVPNQSQSESEAQQPGNYEIKNSVYILDDQTFRQAIEEFDFTLVKFFAPWCGHCKSLAPIYKDVAQTLESTESPVKIASVDCTVHKTICQQKGIRGYPTVLFFQKGKADSTKYTGPRNKDGMIKWLSENISSQTTDENDL